mmetsp:Transcript_97468/g.303581  ORF Transcript_97468/g.303581 Transcript_97468/m.303581 type:complete len:294 (-) Transcript_97468:2946-3827(-)
MRRERLMMPAHVCEQALQMPQSPKTQSMSGSQEMSALQTLVSLESPLTGVPHLLAMRATCRDRHEVPPPQEAEHPDQADQSAHKPSSQDGAAQECELQARTPSLSRAWHCKPPWSGICAMLRSRFCWPPPHLREQALQSPHSPHWQSSFGQAASSHFDSSDRCKLQPSPSRPRERRTSRLRCLWAAPQLELHCDHSCQSETWQSCTSQGAALQPAIEMSSLGQALPPAVGKTMIWRCLRVWPPPQVLSQPSQVVHSETTQSTSPASTQASVSSRPPPQAAPMPRAMALMSRRR